MKAGNASKQKLMAVWKSHLFLISYQLPFAEGGEE